MVQPAYTLQQEINRKTIIDNLKADTEVFDAITGLFLHDESSYMLRVGCKELENFLVEKLACCRIKHNSSQHNFINLPDGMSRGSLKPRHDSNKHSSRGVVKPDFLDSLRTALDTIGIDLGLLKTLREQKKKQILARQLYCTPNL